jgi:hypothetical protein
MSGEAQTVNPAAAPENRPVTETPDPATPDGGELNATQKQEFFVLKKKAEEFNKLADENRALGARLQQMERLAVGQGAGQATDPEAAEIAALMEQATYDPAIKHLLKLKQESILDRAELWLAKQMAPVPEAKREQVETIIRAYGYQIGAKEALRIVSDPEAETVKQRLAQLEDENKKLKERGTQSHGTSPATTTPATTSEALDVENMPWSEAQSILRVGGDRAKALRDKMDTRKVKIEYGR